MVHQQAERTVGIAPFEELDGMIGYEFGGVTLLADILAVGVVRTERGIVIVALIVEQAVEVETLGFALHVPLAHHGGRISPIPQQLREERFARVDARPEEELRVGDRGTTLSRLSPMGKVEIGGRIYEAKSQGPYVDPHREVEVTGFENFSVIVKSIE